MRVLPAHAPQDRSYRSDGRDETATASARTSPVCRRERSAAANTGTRIVRPTAAGALTGVRRLEALRRLQSECGRVHAPFLFRLVNPGLPGKPFVIGLADQTEGA